jgi:excisionase family DNA binding protein
MARPVTTCEAMTVGQVAKRWGISRDHVRRLIDEGRLPGVFTIPSSGRYRATMKIPVSSVIQVETEDWVVTPKQPKRARPRPSRQRDDSGPTFRHFPNLRASLEPASGSGEGAPG